MSVDIEDISDNELDQFDTRREKIMLDAAGDYLGGEASDDSASDEEVMALKHQSREESDGDNNDDDDEDDEDEDVDEDDEEGGWGSKRNYYGGDDASDDEDAKQMVEEALRQQKKHLQELNMEDYVDEDMMEDWKKVEDADVNEAQVHLEEDREVDFEAMDDADKLKHLTGQYPEFVPLLKEFNSLLPKLNELREQSISDIVSAKVAALSAYLSCISSYFALFVENLKTKETTPLKDHPVMESLLSSREVWRQASELNTTARASRYTTGSTDVDVDGEADELVNDEMMDMEDSDDMERDGMDRLETDSEEEEDIEEDADADQDASDKELNIDLNSKRVIKKVSKAPVAGDYTETALPDKIDREDKDRKKKSLRFYTSKIDQSVQKNARNEKFTGDLDLPYKERLFERQQRLLEEARKRGLGADNAQLGDDLDGENFGSDDDNLANEINADAADYYDSVRMAKSDKKDARRAAHEDAKRAARDGKLAELKENVGADGKRALNFQIMKNKGLTPHRKNENRNARVKKRKKYEQAKKKLKSVRQVYEGSQGPYGGEKTGIKKGLSRSVKLI